MYCFCCCLCLQLRDTYHETLSQLDSSTQTLREQQHTIDSFEQQHAEWRRVEQELRAQLTEQQQQHAERIHQLTQQLTEEQQRHATLQQRSSFDLDRLTAENSRLQQTVRELTERPVDVSHTSSVSHDSTQLTVLKQVSCNVSRQLRCSPACIYGLCSCIFVLRVCALVAL